jgi:hypothetical protein
MAQTTYNDGDPLSTVRAVINGNANDAQSKLVDQVAINTLADLSSFLVSGTYELPSGTYYFNAPVDFGTADILLTDLDGCYDIRTSCIAQLDYSGVTPFIASGNTGQVITFAPYRVSTPNALVFDGDGFVGNSFISDFGIFVGCKEMVRLTGWSFFTVDAFAGVACEKGVTLTDVANINLAKPQWNLSLSNGEAFINLIGASSGQMIAGDINSQPSSSDFFFNFDATWGGHASIVGGAHQTGGGLFFKGSRNQEDVDIEVLGVTEVPNSQAKVKGYIAEGDEALTTIVTQDVPVVVAGTWTNTINKRFSFDAAGKITYLGHETLVFPITAKLQATPASGSNREYEFHFRVNGTTIDPASRDVIRADAGNPAKVIIITELELNENDYVEIVVASTSSTVNVTGEAATVII